jgi:hypothetical protein
MLRHFRLLSDCFRDPAEAGLGGRLDRSAGCHVYWRTSGQTLEGFLTKIFTVAIVLVVLCGCTRISSGKREAMRPAVAALVKANANRDDAVMGDAAFEDLRREMRIADAAGNPSLAGDVKASRDLGKCVLALSNYRAPEVADYKKESGESADHCVAELKREFQ